uniref:Conotoxin Cal6.19 n=1 Tax=Californiconus californicus TaxID=1736779 RepID=C619_CONCL|nr:RecName: Full=Conotoxin Cal6.19; AltName: Full=O1_cal6.19; Flags: Precursor [Californiconus californicus]
MKVTCVLVLTLMALTVCQVATAYCINVGMCIYDGYCCSNRCWGGMCSPWR